MTPAFELDSFEYVEAGPGLALVRLAGTWAGATPADVSLFAYAGGERVPLPPLPAPPASGTGWRGAFSGTPELVREGDARFELEAPGVGIVELPAPVEHGAPRPEPEPAPRAAAAPEPEHEPPAEPRREPDADPRPEAEPAEPRPTLRQHDPSPARRLFGRRREPIVTDATLRQELAAERAARVAAEHSAAYQRERAERAEEVLRKELSGTLGQAAEVLVRIDGYERQRVSFDEELEAVREAHETRLSAFATELEETRAELNEAIAELNAAHEQLDTVHGAHSIELKAARQQRDTANERAQALEEQLRAADAEIENLRADLEDRQALIERARAEAATASAEADEMQAMAERLREAIGARVRAAERRQSRRFVRAQGSPMEPEALTAAREELRAGLDRLAALEEQAEALRGAIRKQLGGGPQSPLQEALPLEPLGPPQG